MYILIAVTIHKQFTDLLSHYGFSVSPTTATHQAGGTIDAVVTRCEVTDVSRGAECQPSVSVNDVGLSDHHLLIWSLRARKLSTPTQTASRRFWRQLDVDQLREQLKASTLCQTDKWPDDIDDMAAMYESELNTLLDCLIPSRVVTLRPRPSDPWFDDECREAKRLTRRLERAYSAVCRRAASQVNTSASADVVATNTAWYAQRRNYRDLGRRKSHAFWCATVKSERESPSKLWRSVNLLLGRGKPPTSSDINVDEFSKFFHDKVDAVKQSTTGALDPTFSTNRSGVSLVTFTPVSVSCQPFVVCLTKALLQTRFRSR